MILIYFIFVKFLIVYGNPVTDNFKDQYCTDPRTMQKHAAYSEWADAYSCTRHRCQPGGRNLAIYTVGCKRVEAPESAIECEEVVEDTNMQFPYCCTRLRCLVVVRSGEVWTRVLGQPWETLPAAPWSHMYKMKKPPPTGGTPFAQKGTAEGPIYELGSESQPEKVLRSTKMSTEEPCRDVKLRAAASPDIVIALSTKDEEKKEKSSETRRKKKMRKSSTTDEDVKLPQSKFETVEDIHNDANDKPEKNDVTSWTDIPQSQWTEPELLNEMDVKAHNDNADADLSVEDGKALARTEEKEKANNLQALVDAIGTRMRDIENVVQKMSEKVQQTNPTEEVSGEKKSALESTREHLQKMFGKPKKADRNANADKYKRFKSQTGSKYLHVTGEAKTEQPLFVEDPHLSGYSYFSDASNNVVRRADSSKEPQLTYMAPVDTSGRRNAVDTTDGRKKRKHIHKKKHKKSHKKHQHKDEKRKIKTRTNSLEANRGVVSLEDSSAAIK